jgi:Zn-finger in Ran binding protein and others
MNGRALNEKAIEVSPSSSRVLDRAAEILCAFPPSKNRPRPGDWTCPGCGFSNFQRRTACFRCSFPASGAAPSSDPMGGYGAYGYGPPSMMPHHHMGGGHHGHGMGHGRGGGPVPFRAGDWKCGSEGCEYHNFAKNVNCLRCGAPRSSAAVVADSAFPPPMHQPGSYGMGPNSGMGPGSMGSTPGPGPFAVGAGGFGPGAGFGQQFGGPPPSQYALPSGLGAPTGGYGPPMGAMTPNYSASNMSHSSFGNPAAQAAFTGADNQLPSTGGHNGFYNNEGAGPLAFLNSALGGLSIGDDQSRRNGNANTAKSPS